MPTSDSRSPGLPTVSWDPGQYLRFAGPRLQPPLDLLGRLSGLEPRRIWDLGCGTGDMTRLLARRWPQAEVVGIDQSSEMLAKAAATAGEVRWLEADIATWSPPQPADLLFSNATLHWLPDHGALLPRLLGSLAPGGVLAVQMPLSWDQPSHLLMREVLVGEDGGRPLGTEALRQSLEQPPVLQAAEYFELLSPLARQVDVWETTYLHVLDGDDPVLEWARGTGLRPILESLEETEQGLFLERYRAGLHRLYPERADGGTFYPFHRLFFCASV